MYLLRRTQRCFLPLALLVACAAPSRGANVLTALFASTPVISPCQAGPTATTFTSADPRVSLYLVIEKMAAGDVLTMEWGNPSGRIVNTLRFSATPNAGSYCMAGSMDVEGTSAATETGKWTVRLLLNGSLLSAPSFTLTAAPRGAEPAISRGGVVNGADFTPNFAPGILLSIYGTSLAARTAVAAEAPLPLALEGTFVEVTAGGKFYRAPIFFVSAGQINAQLPFELASATTVQLRVFSATGGSMPEAISLSRNAPRMLTTSMDGRGEAIVAHADYTLVSGASPARPREVLVAFLTGLGAVSPAVASGRPGGDDGKWGPLNRTVDDVIVEVNGRPATVSFSGLAPGWIGLYQINFQVPDGVSGSVSLVIKAGGAESQRNVTLRCGGSGVGVPLGSETIPATGGTLSAGPVSITVPAGAFPAAATLSAERVAESTAPPASQTSAIYAITGLPEETTGAITITLQSAKGNPDPNRTYVVIEEQGEGGGRMIVKATVEGGRISAVLPRLHQLTPHTQAASAGKARLAATGDGTPAGSSFPQQMWVYAFEDDVWTHGNFRIYGANGLDSAKRTELAEQLDRALAWLEAAGFNWRSKRSGPIEVDCTRSGQYASGGVRYSLSTSAEAHLLLHTEEIDVVHSMGVVTYPLAALVTDLYYPSPQLLRVQDRLAWFWLDSAVGYLVTAEIIGGLPPRPSPEGFVSLLRDGLDFHRKSAIPSALLALEESRTHGVDATGFLNSLRTKDGHWRWLGQVYNLRPPSAGAAWLSPIEATSLIRPALGAEWLQYCRDGQGANFAAMLDWARQRTQNINDVSRLDYEFQAAVSDLSALPHLVDVSGGWTDGTKMILSLKGLYTAVVIDQVAEYSKGWRGHVGVADPSHPSLVIGPFYSGGFAQFLVTVVSTLVAKPPPVSLNAQISMTMSAQQAASIQVAPNALQFSAMQGGQAAPYQSLSITRTGSSPLGWNASVLNGAWIRFSGSTTGTDAGTVRVGVDITGLAAGKYSGTVRITSPSARNNPVDVPVSLEVQSSTAPAAAPAWLKDLAKISLWYEDFPWVCTIGGKEVGASTGCPGVIGYNSWMDPFNNLTPTTTVLKWDEYNFSLDVTYTDKVLVGRTQRFELYGNLSQDLSVIETVRFRSTTIYTGRDSPQTSVLQVNVAQIPVTSPLRDVGGAGTVSTALLRANPTRYVTDASSSLHYTGANPASQDVTARLDWNRPVVQVPVANPIRVTLQK